MSQEAINRTVRTSRRARVLGPDAHCSRCGYTDQSALVQRTRQKQRVILCYECAQATDRKATAERHHPLGQANDPSTVGAIGNLHRDLSDRQLDWPEEVRKNEHRNPLWWIAGIFYSLYDYLQWLVEFPRRIGDMLVAAGHWAEQQGGPQWWVKAGITYP
jgi:hypothetical protein